MMKTSQTREKKAIAIALALSTILISTSSQSAEPGNVTELARSLVAIRQEVESLSNDVQAKRDELKNRLSSFAVQKQEMEMERHREEMRLKQLLTTKAKESGRVVDDGRRETLLVPVVTRSSRIIEARIRAGLPFKTEERVSEIEKIRDRLKEGLLKSAQAVARLWDRVEDELRLSQENGIYSQVVTVGNEEMLVDVARVGMVMIFYKTKDGRVGRAEKRDGRWGWEPLEAPNDRKRVFNLFDSFKKQIRTGFFVLPAALPGNRG